MEAHDKALIYCYNYCLVKKQWNTRKENKNYQGWIEEESIVLESDEAMSSHKKN